MRARWGCVVIAWAVASGGPARGQAQDCSGGTFYAASAVVVVSALIDIATADASARKYNSTHLSVAPTYDPHRGAFGFAARLSLGRARPAAPRAIATRPQTTPPQRKSPGTATALSFGFTAIPIAIGLAMKSEGSAYPFLGGVIVGPSMGHFYA